MKRFRDLSVRVKLTIGFSVMSAMVVIIGLMGMFMHESSAKLIIVGATVLVAATISTVVAKLISNSVYKPIRKLTAAADRLASGDIDIDIPISTGDEIGKLAASFRTMISAVQAMLADTNALAEAAIAGDYSTRADESSHAGHFGAIIGSVNRMLDAIVTPLNEFSAMLGKLSLNDVTATITTQYPGKPGEMAAAMNKVIGQMRIITRGMVEVSKGDYSLLPAFESVGRNCENDQLTPAAILLMKTVNALVDEADEMSAAVVRGDLGVRGDSSKFMGRYREMIDGMNGIMDALSTPLLDATSALDTLARNDLTRGMGDAYMGVFAELSQSVNGVIDTLNGTLAEINASAEQVAAGTTQVAAGAQALSQGATEQASAIEELTASLGDIGMQTRQNAIGAGEATELAAIAKNEAENGNTKMDELQRAMKEINDASADISKIIRVIDDIAFQTNLLALNAAVEAARAGQHGKGFAVVAQEVRNLAQRSASAASETTGMIEESIKRVKAGTKIANETAEALERIMSGVEKVTGLVGGIGKASGDQAGAVAQINAGILQVSQVVQTNSATAEESAAASEELSSQAKVLKDMVGQFVLREQLKPTRATVRLPGTAPRAAAAGRGGYGKY